MSAPEARDFAEELNANPGDGWIAANGLRFLRATCDEVVAELELRPMHMQAYGIVHGGIHAAIIETVASVGAAMDAMPHGRSVVGLENHTSFLRAVRAGKLHATAKPLTRGRKTQVWEASILDDEGRLAATGRVRLLVLEPDAMVGGERIGMKPG